MRRRGKMKSKEPERLFPLFVCLLLTVKPSRSCPLRPSDPEMAVGKLRVVDGALGVGARVVATGGECEVRNRREAVSRRAMPLLLGARAMLF